MPLHGDQQPQEQVDQLVADPNTRQHTTQPLLNMHQHQLLTPLLALLQPSSNPLHLQASVENGVQSDVAQSQASVPPPLGSLFGQGATSNSIFLSLSKCEECGTKEATIQLTKQPDNFTQNLCPSCTKEKNPQTGTRGKQVSDTFKCLGCDQIFDSFDKVRKRQNHVPHFGKKGDCPLVADKKQKISSGTSRASTVSTVNGNKRSSSSSSTTDRSSKRQKIRSVPHLQFLLKQLTFECEEKLRFNNNRQFAHLFFPKTMAIHLSPDHREPQYSILLHEFFPRIANIQIVAANETTFMLKNDELTMIIALPSWSKPEEGDIAKVNVQVKFTNCQTTIKSQNGILTHINMHNCPADITFQKDEAGTLNTISTSVYQAPLIDLRNLFEPDDLTNFRPLGSLDARGFTDIELSTANFDYGDLERALQSNTFNLNTKDNLGYTKEFWCHYFKNMKALEMIQDAKIRNMNLSRLCDLDSIVLNILSFINCGFTLNFALHDSIYSYLTRNQYSLSSQSKINPYKTLFGRFKSGKIHMLYSDQPIIGQSTIVSAAELSIIEKEHDFLDFGLPHWVIHLICSEASSKIIMWLKSTMKEMLNEMKVIGCGNGSDQCKHHKDLSQSVTYDFGYHSTLNLDDLSTSVHTLQLVHSYTGLVKLEGSAPENLARVILGPHFHIDNSLDVEQLATCCSKIRHLELGDVTFEDEQMIHYFWEVLGGTAPNLRNVSIDLTGQNESAQASHIENLLSNCPFVQNLSVITHQGTPAVSALVKQYSPDTMINSIELKYGSCDEETLNKFMILYGNMCQIECKMVIRIKSNDVVSEQASLSIALNDSLLGLKNVGEEPLPRSLLLLPEDHKNRIDKGHDKTIPTQFLTNNQHEFTSMETGSSCSPLGDLTSEEKAHFKYIGQLVSMFRQKHPDMIKNLVLREVELFSQVNDMCCLEVLESIRKGAAVREPMLVANPHDSTSLLPSAIQFLENTGTISNYLNEQSSQMRINSLSKEILNCKREPKRRRSDMEDEDQALQPEKKRLKEVFNVQAFVDDERVDDLVTSKQLANISERFCRQEKCDNYERETKLDAYVVIKDENEINRLVHTYPTISNQFKTNNSKELKLYRKAYFLWCAEGN